MDKREGRDSRTIDELGIYHPIEKEDKQIAFNVEKARHWIENGALVSDTVRSLFNKKGVALARKKGACEA
jgi:small subunit ribosomal protein S16